MAKRDALLSRLGKSAEELANLDMDVFNSLKRDELAHVVTRLSSAANKRLRNFEEKNETSRVYKAAIESGGKFTAKDKDLNELRHEYIRVKNFLNAKTGSVRGTRKVRKEFFERININAKNAPADFEDVFWRIANDIPESTFFVKDSEPQQQYLANVVYSQWDKTKDYNDESDYISLYNSVQEAIRADYESEEAESNTDYVRV